MSTLTHPLQHISGKDHDIRFRISRINAEKTKLMTNNTSGINTEIKVNGQKLETVTSFKYLGSFITDEGFKAEIPLSHPSSCVLCELWTLTAELQTGIQASHTKTVLLTRKSVPTSAGNRTTRRPPDKCKETQTTVIWSSPNPRRQLRSEKNGGNWLWNHLWCPNNPRF